MAKHSKWVDLITRFLAALARKVPQLALDFINIAFAPKSHLKQLVLVSLVQLLSSLISRALKHHKPTANKELLIKQENATSYEEWLAASVHIQQQSTATTNSGRQSEIGTGGSAGDRDFCEQLYMRANNYAHMQQMGDEYGLMFHLRSELMRRQLGGAGYSRDGSSKMFKQNMAVSRAIEQYQAHVCDALRYIGQPTFTPRAATSPTPNAGSNSELAMEGTGPSSSSVAQPQPMTSAAQRLAFINETRHAYGRTALLLSGGGAFGVKHIGVIQALFKARLLPRIISGTSAGSIVAAYVGVKTDAEIEGLVGNSVNVQKMCETLASLPFFGLRRGESGHILERGSSTASLSAILGADFSPAASPRGRGKTIAWDLRHGRRHLAKARTLLDSSVLSAALEWLCGDLTFLEAFDRSGRVLNIVVTRSDGRVPALLCNYLTTPQLLVYSAALASCSIPGVFEAVELMAKDRDGSTVPYFKTGGWKFTDGGLQADLPKERLTELFNVNQFIVSQVNPISSLFVPASTHLPPIIEEGLLFLKEQLTGFVKGLSHFGKGTFIRPGGMRLADLALQEYEGTLTIYPTWHISEMSKFLSNFDTERVQQYVLDGARATWPHLELIHSLCEIEYTLDEVAAELQCAIRGRPPPKRRPPSRTLSIGSSVDGEQSVSNGNLRGKLPSYVSLAAYGQSPNAIDGDEFSDTGPLTPSSPRVPIHWGSTKNVNDVKLPARISSHAALYNLAAFETSNDDEPPASIGLATYQA